MNYKTQDQEMITIDDICDMLCVGKSTAYSLLRSGKIHGAFRIGHIWKVTRSAIYNYINEQQQNSYSSTATW